MWRYSPRHPAMIFAFQQYHGNRGQMITTKFSFSILVTVQPYGLTVISSARYWPLWMILCHVSWPDIFDNKMPKSLAIWSMVWNCPRDDISLSIKSTTFCQAKVLASEYFLSKESEHCILKGYVLASHKFCLHHVRVGEVATLNISCWIFLWNKKISFVGSPIRSFVAGGSLRILLE